MNKHGYSIRLQQSDIKKGLQNIIVGPSASYVIDVICNGLVESDFKAEVLMKAMMGVEYKLKYKVGDKVFIRYDHTATWRHDKTKTELEFCTVKKGYIIAEITHITPYTNSAYEIKYDAIDTAGNVIVDKYDVPESLLEKVDDLKLKIDDKDEEEVSLPGQV